VSARRRWPRWLVALLVVGPLLELVVVALVAQRLGAGWTVLLLLLGSVVGLALLVREVPRSWRGLREAAGFGPPVVVDGGVVAGPPGGARGPQVGQRLLDGGLVLVGAVLVLLPGFLSDVLGVVCLLPFTRAVPRRLLADLVQRRAARYTGARVAGEPVRGPGPADAPPRGQVLQGEVVDDERKHL
jgi:UPF0716 protein FxsA